MPSPGCSCSFTFSVISGVKSRSANPRRPAHCADKAQIDASGRAPFDPAKTLERLTFEREEIGASEMQAFPLASGWDRQGPGIARVPLRGDGVTAEADPRAAPKVVEAPLKYLANAEDVTVYIASVGGGDTSLHEGNYVMRPVAIRNGRARGEGFSLDREGFVLVAHPSAVSDFYDDGEIAAVYEAEVKALVGSATGAVRVEIFDHTRRAASVDVQKARMIREPASIIHNDYTARSGPQRLRDHFPEAPEQAEALLQRHFIIVNVWRSIRGTVLDAPLALCDASSLAPEDLVSVERQAKDRIGEIQQAVYNPAHRWYYFPEMQPDEALLIKTYDSATDGRARFTIHTSFDDPTAPAGAPPRESLETRCFAFF